MRVVQLNCVYNFGSTGKIVKNLHEGLIKSGIESYVFYGRGPESTDCNATKLSKEVVVKFQSFFSKVTGYVYGGSCLTTWRFLKALKRLKPDIVHLQCINASIINIYKVLEYLQVHDIPVVLTLHAEFLYTGGCSHAFDCENYKKGCYKCEKSCKELGTFFVKRTHYHWIMMKSLIEKSRNMIVVGVSEWVKMRAESSPIFATKSVNVIHNGVDTNVFYYRAMDDILKVMHKYNIPNNKKIVLHVTPNFKDPNKGREYLLKIASLSLLRKNDLCFVIVGFNDDISILPTNIIPIPFISKPEELASLYSLSRVTLLLSKRETYSMVCAESLCCGTPVIGFKAGAPELIAIKSYSSFFDYADVDSVYDKLCHLTIERIDKYAIMKSAVEKYSKDNMINKYLSIYSTFF